MHRHFDTVHAALLALLLLLTGVAAADEQRFDDTIRERAAAPAAPGPEGPAENPGSLAAPPPLAGTDAPARPESQTQHAAQATPGTSPQRRRTRLVYACHDSSVPVFSDRPCGADPHAWRIDVPPPSVSGAPPSTRPAVPAAATRPIAAATPRDDRSRVAERCARLEEQLAAINARMREGYSAREAARLWQRWREAKAKLHAERC